MSLVAATRCFLAGLDAGSAGAVGCVLGRGGGGGVFVGGGGGGGGGVGWMLTIAGGSGSSQVVVRVFGLK